MEIILASESPGRKELMERSGVPFRVMPAHIDELAVVREYTGGRGCLPDTHVTVLAAAKADCICGKTDAPCVVIAADTIVFHNNTILEKPADGQDAFNMLKSLQGQTHKVYTGVTVIVKLREGRQKQTFCETALVRFLPLDDGEIAAYVETGEPLGRSGSYSVSGKGSLLIDCVNGDFNAVVGLPLARTYAVLKGMGVDLLKKLHHSRKFP